MSAATMNLLPIPARRLAPDGSINMKDVPFTRISSDTDEPAKALEDELDILAVSMAYDDKYIYIKMDLDAPMKEGDKDKRIYNLVGIGLMDEDIEVVPDASKMLSAVPLIAYAPLATTMGLPKCAVFDMSNYKKGKFGYDKKGIDCKVVGESIYFRAEKSAVKMEGVRGVRVLAAAGQIILQPTPDARIADAADITLVKFGEFTGDPAAPWPYSNIPASPDEEQE